MKKKFDLIDLDCANCAAKMEDAIRRISGVKTAAVSFIQQKLTLETQDGADFDEVLAQVVKVCRKVEPDCRIVLK